ncbi:NUDIX domain-containing protein (plasmid) [Streptomyces microflavus]|uniref:NUDIX domain-containing protein n=1 Tax=Streptomyces microflavus TaxID=1919 RepID=UPI002E13C9DC|nr:NUDIX domain-containing protein [Streptomyces microflavus]WSR96405.1 NUDIX domain-containing protein [Streptomyces microflavus]
MSSRTELRTILTSYLARHPAEDAALAPVRAALDAPHAGPAVVTCSALVIDRDGKILHAPDSPTGPGLPRTKPQDSDRSPLATALRAVREQTGIQPGDLCLTPQYLRTPIDITPAPGAADTSIADFRFAFYLARTAQAEASWRPTPGSKAAALDGQPVPLNASALIHNSRGEYLLHLRDMRDDIWAPGCWALLGGGHEPGDLTPEDTIRRELREEAGIHPEQLETFRDEEILDADGLTLPVRIFSALWDGDPAQLPLTEGVMLAWFPPATVPRLRLGGETLALVQRHASKP